MRIKLLHIVSGLLLIFPHLIVAQQYRIEEGTFSDRPTGTYFGAPEGGLTDFDSSPYQDFYMEHFNQNNKWVFQMNFRLLPPNGYDSADITTLYPLVVMMHGAGESGRSWPGHNNDPYPEGTPEYRNNDRNLHHGGKQHLAAVNRDPSQQKAFPGFVVFPQNETGFWNANERDSFIKIVELVIEKYNIDPNKVYIHGLSLGGGGVWNVIQSRPDLFAAWMVMSAAMTAPYDYDRISHIPSRIFQGENDDNPRPIQTLTSVKRLEMAGGTPLYTLYKETGHATWNHAYGEDDFFSWMLSQSKLNIHADGGLTVFCENPGVNTTIGISPGFVGYQWKKDGEIIEGATGNELHVTDFGTYTAGFMRQGDTGYTWSHPLEITIKEVPPVIIQASGSVVLNSLDDQEEVTLFSPEGIITSEWFKDGVHFSNDGSITVNQEGAYVLVGTTVDCETTSEPVFVTTGGDITIDEPPFNLTASAASETQIDLFWEDVSPNKTGLEVYRSTTQGSNYTFLGLFDPGAVSFSDTNLISGTTYYYVVRSVNSEGASEPTAEISATTLTDKVAPEAPNNLEISRVDINYITLNWKPSIDNIAIDKYLVYQVGNATPVGETNELTLTVENLSEGQVYQFYVQAMDKAGNLSLPSNQVTGITSFCGLYYEAYGPDTYNSVDELNDPGKITGTGKVNDFNINVVSAHSPMDNYFGIIFNGYIRIDVAGEYTFYTKSDDGSQLSIDDVVVVDNDGRRNGAQKVQSDPVYLGAGIHKIQVKFFQAPSPYFLEVGYTPPGGSEQVIPGDVLCTSPAALPPVPAAPTLLTATGVSDTQIDLSWADNSDNESGFEIYRSLDGIEFKLVHTNGAGIASYSDSGLEAMTTYFYKVRAIGPTGESGFTHVNGMIRYAYYEGTWSELPHFNKLTPVKIGSVENFSLSPRDQGQNNYFAFVFEGIIDIPVEATYTFYTSSDDGSKLYIDEVPVVDNDGLHGLQERSGFIYLTEGQHKIKVAFFEKDGSEVLQVRYEGPGISKQTIPNAVIISHASATTGGDITPPSQPTDVTLRTKTHESVGLSWTASSDNVGVIAYEIYNYGDAIATVDVEGRDIDTVSYLITGLASDTQYGLEIKARDKAGNRSPNSSQVDVKTNAFDPLPVEFINFTGAFKDQKVILQWSTATETDNDYFTVERSVSGDDFEAIGTINGAGDSQSRMDYEYVDFMPIGGTAYYRIRQTDFNGRAEFSNIISVNSIALTSRSLKLYPNPTGGQNLYVQLKSADAISPVSIQIMGVLGMKYHQGVYDATEMAGSIHLSPVSTLAPGVYTLIVRQGNMIVQEKLIVN